MSAFVGYLFDDIVYIGTDTLATVPYNEGDTRLKPLNFVPKVFHLPQLKCVFGCTGYQIVGSQFYNFVTQRIIGKDIRAVINTKLSIFRDILREVDCAEFSGTLFIYGYDHSLEKFTGHYTRIIPGEASEWTALHAYSENENRLGLVVVPSIDNFEEQINNSSTGELFENINEYIRKIIITQKSEDDKKLVYEQVGIGGDITLTTMGFDQHENFVIKSEIIHEFPDKEELGELMMKLHSLPFFKFSQR